MLTNVNSILNFLNIKHCDLLDLNKGKIKELFQSKTEAPDWRCALIQELLSIYDKQLFVDMDHLEVKQLLEYVSTFR